MDNKLVRATYSPSSVDQHELGQTDGDGADGIPSSGMETIYNASALCTSCGGLMNPVQVIYGQGVCPECQSRRNAAVVKDRMA